MVIKAHENLIGARVFLLGVILALIAGLVSVSNSRLQQILLIILAVLGLIVGFFVPEKEVKTFLMASISVVIVSYAGVSGLVLRAAISGLQLGTIVTSILGALLVLFVPATIVVAVKTAFASAQS